MSALPPHTDREILIAAGRALGRIDLMGIRGITLISVQDIEAMAVALVILGLVSIPPSQLLPPERLIHTPSKEY